MNHPIPPQLCDCLACITSFSAYAATPPTAPTRPPHPSSAPSFPAYNPHAPPSIAYNPSDTVPGLNQYWRYRSGLDDSRLSWRQRPGAETCVDDRPEILHQGARSEDRHHYHHQQQQQHQHQQHQQAGNRTRVGDDRGVSVAAQEQQQRELESRAGVSHIPRQGYYIPRNNSSSSNSSAAPPTRSAAIEAWTAAIAAAWAASSATPTPGSSAPQGSSSLTPLTRSSVGVAVAAPFPPADPRAPETPRYSSRGRRPGNYRAPHVRDESGSGSESLPSAVMGGRELRPGAMRCASEQNALMQPRSTHSQSTRPRTIQPAPAPPSAIPAPYPLAPGYTRPPDEERGIPSWPMTSYAAPQSNGAVQLPLPVQLPLTPQTYHAFTHALAWPAPQVPSQQFPADPAHRARVRIHPQLRPPYPYPSHAPNPSHAHPQTPIVQSRPRPSTPTSTQHPPHPHAHPHFPSPHHTPPLSRGRNRNTYFRAASRTRHARRRWLAGRRLAPRRSAVATPGGRSTALGGGFARGRGSLVRGRSAGSGSASGSGSELGLELGSRGGKSVAGRSLDDGGWGTSSSGSYANGDSDSAAPLSSSSFCCTPSFLALTPRTPSSRLSAPPRRRARLLRPRPVGVRGVDVNGRGWRGGVYGLDGRYGPGEYEVRELHQNRGYRLQVSGIKVRGLRARKPRARKTSVRKARVHERRGTDVGAPVAGFVALAVMYVAIAAAGLLLGAFAVVSRAGA